MAYTVGCLSALAEKHSANGRLDYVKIWAMQAAGDVLERQLLVIAEAMMGVLRSPPLAGQNISEWAKQQACRKKALETAVPVEPGLDAFLLGKGDAKSADRDERDRQRVADGMHAVAKVMEAGAVFWISLRTFAKAKRLTTLEDDGALTVACSMPRKVPTDWQAAQLLVVKRRCEGAGFTS